MDAVADDEEAARLHLATQPEPSPHEERWSEWSPERAALARIDDRLQVIAQAVQSFGGKTPPFRPAPRPESAVDRLRREQRVEVHRSLVARLVRQP